jgi:hypothetical protein
MTLHVGKENPFVPYDIKVGIACTEVLAEGMWKAFKPVGETLLYKANMKEYHMEEQLKRKWRNYKRWYYGRKRRVSG